MTSKVVRLLTIRRIVGVVVAVALLGVNLLVQGPIDSQRARGLYGEPMDWLKDMEKIDVHDFTFIVVAGILGGFRGVAANMLWMKSDEYWHGGKVDRMLPLLDAITMLDPHFIDSWRIYAWHIAYNMSVEPEVAGNPEKVQQCYDGGLEILRRGIQWNKDKYELYFEMGWTLYDKLGDYEEAAKCFRLADEQRNAPRDPNYLLRMMGHAYERIPDVDRALAAYGELLKREPGDVTGTGATKTIKAYYGEAWKCFKAGDYKNAEAAIKRYLVKDPKDTIGRHLLARIYEKTGQLKDALAVWKECAKLHTDKLAPHRVKDLEVQLGLSDRGTAAKL